jgi:hypothetical protein
VALLLLGPGVLLHALLARHRRAVELPLLAAAFWVIALWWVRLLPWGWSACTPARRSAGRSAPTTSTP